MSDLSTQELEKLAKLSGLALSEEESKAFEGQLKQLLDYTEEITNLSLGAEVEATRSVNVFREDKVIKKKTDDVTGTVSKFENNYFVVPKVLD
ncbi:Asp-tRNA(Asn)/Glu-tRNA(Gln) amidotransferase subunit GatC [Candidatus Dependentiae bacterium]